MPKDELDNLLNLENSEYESEQCGENYTARWVRDVARLKRYFINKKEGTDANTSFFTYNLYSECKCVRVNAKACSDKVAV